MISEESTLVDVAFAVCTALSDAGVTAVLTGGSAATFYAPHANQSEDLDFVVTIWGDGNGRDALLSLGAKRGLNGETVPDIRRGESLTKAP